MKTADRKLRSKAKASSSEQLRQQQLQIKQNQRAKTSSERGRAFRERERQRVAELELSIAELQKQIHDKTFLRGVWQAKYLRTRHSKYGSLAQLAEEYYSILRVGVQDTSSPSERDQRVDPVEFLLRVTHPNALLGDLIGPENMVDQWRKYTAAHMHYETEIDGLDVRGPEEDPVVFACVRTRARLTRNTFEMLFPNALDNEPLIQRCIGKPITYSGTTQLRFSAEMQIVCQQVHFNFVEGLVAAGVSLHEIHQLMLKCKISPACTIVDSPVVVIERSKQSQ